MVFFRGKCLFLEIEKILCIEIGGKYILKLKLGVVYWVLDFIYDY